LLVNPNIEESVEIALPYEKGVFPREMDVKFLHYLVVVRTYGAELRMELRQFGNILQRSLVRFDDPERVVEHSCLDKSRLRHHARLLAHREEPGVFLSGEVHRVAKIRRVCLGFGTNVKTVLIPLRGLFLLAARHSPQAVSALARSVGSLRSWI
jgi:hypothetical protein